VNARRRRAFSCVGLAPIATVVAWTGCNAILGNGYGHAVPTPDAPEPKGEDGTIDSDGAVIDAIAQPTYSALEDATKWAWVDLGTVLPTLPLGDTFQGALFDGRYVTFIPGDSQNPNLVRFDTTQSVTFNRAMDWSLSGVPNTICPGCGYAGGVVLDGGALLLTPYLDGAGGGLANGVFLRYDGVGPLGPPGWSTFAFAPDAQPRPAYFYGSAFDGRYVYFAPAGPHVIPSYDTRATFGVESSWQTFDVQRLLSTPIPYHGAVFDGRYVTFIPCPPVGGSDIVVRYDTAADGGIGHLPNWSQFDLAAIPAGSGSVEGVAFTGGVFDGKYLYMAAAKNSLNLILRFETKKALEDMSAWSTFVYPAGGRTMLVAGATFDGRYVTFVPSQSTLVVRYDTQGSFMDGAAWSYFDLDSVPNRPTAQQGFVGAAFDGRHLYLVPNVGRIAWRFDAKNPPSLPSTYRGSFL
jgi:hypothetical protein